MPTYDAGDARLQIFGDASRFKQKLEEDLKKIQVDYKLPVQPNLAQATADIERWRQQQQRNTVELKVDVDTSAATGKIAALSRTLSGLGGGGGGGGGGRGGLLGGGSGALLVNAGALAVGSLPAAATAIANVAASIQQLAGAGLVLPGVLSGIVASVGTVKVGLTGVSDAFDAVQKSSDGTTASIDAANAALAKLAPSAADAVRAASDLKTELAAALVLPTQQNLFDGLGASARKLVDSQLPIVQRGMTGLATSLNQNAKQLLTSLGSDSSQSFLDRIFGNTTDAQSRLTTAIDPIVHAVGTLTAAGSDSLPRLADAVGAVADRFDRFITAADSDGRLDEWIDKGLDGFTNLGNAVLNIGKSITGVTEAAGTGDLLQKLDDLTGRMATFLNSDAGQAKLTEFFEKGGDQLDKWAPILANIANTLPGVFEAAQQWTDVLLPPLEKITGFLAEHPSLIQAVATAFVAWKTIDGITSLIGNLGRVSDLLGSPGGKGGKGGTGVLGKLALAGALGVGISQLSPDLGGEAAPSTGEVAGDLAVNVGGGALAGGQVAGVPGAIVGGAGGVAASIYDRVAGDLERGQAESRANWEEETVYVPPTVTGPSTSDQLRERIAAGRVPGFSLAPDGQIVGPDGKPVTGLPGMANGGVLPGYSPGVDNLLVPMSGGEGVIVPEVTRKLGPGGISAINRGALTRGYWTGGIIDPNGNPVTAGAAPGPAFTPGGPAPVAPNGSGGGFGSIFGSIASGIQGPIGNALALGQGIAGAAGGGSGAPLSIADRFASMPGIAGLIGSAASSNPAEALSSWGQQTGQWLGNFASKTAGAFGSTLWQGALGLVGLENSILSPNNPWFQAGSQAAGFALDSSGPLGALMGGSSSVPGLGGSSVDPLTTQHGGGSTALVGGTPQSRTSRLGSAAGATSGIVPSGSGAERWRPAVRAALAKYGRQFGITNLSAWENAMVRQIQTESGGNPNAYNGNDTNGRGGTQVVAGIGQFLRSTFDANNITGGAYMDPQAQIAAMISYVSKRYGSDSSGAPLQIGRGVGYANGGVLPGYSPGRDNMLVPMAGGEGVIVPQVTRKLGPEGIAAINRGALTDGFAGGGIIPLGVVPPPPQPNFSAAQSATARQITAPGPSGGRAQVPSANLKQLPAAVPAPGAPPAPAAPGAPPPVAQPNPGAYTPGVGGAPISTAPTGDALNHNLSAINTGISSAASAIGQAASTAIGVAAGAGAGAAGIPGIGAAGAIGPYVAGLIEQGGKVVSDVVNVGSSFLVGSVPGNLGAPGPASGETLVAPQNTPDTAQDNRRSYTFNGIDGSRIVDDIRLKDAQDSQAELARFRG